MSIILNLGIISALILALGTLLKMSSQLNSTDMGKRVLKSIPRIMESTMLKGATLTRFPSFSQRR